MIPPRVSGVFSVSTRVGSDRRWYETLGWRSAREDNIFVPYPVGPGMAFSLWSLPSAAPNVAAVIEAEGDFCGAVLCLVVDSAEEVSSVLETVEEAGGRIVVPDHDVVFGRSSWILDPAGTTWEVCWISGRASAVPFAGAPELTAMPADIAGVVIESDDPDELESFYAKGFGWGDRSETVAGRTVFSLDGGSLVLADGAPGAANLVPMLRPHATATADDLVDQLTKAGATPVAEAGDPSGSPTSVRVVDPFGLAWEITSGR